MLQADAVGVLISNRTTIARLIVSSLLQANSATARVPSLWIYTENDSFFGPAISKQMADAFRRAGGSAEYHLLPAFGEEGHVLVTSQTAVANWRPIVENSSIRRADLVFLSRAPVSTWISRKSPTNPCQRFIDTF